MGMESGNAEVLRAVGLKLPAIVLTPAPSRFGDLRRQYRSARASLPRRVQNCVVGAMVVRALVKGGITWSEIAGGSRLYSPTRQKIAWVLYEAVGWSSDVTAKIMGLRNHTSVIHARWRIQGQIAAGVSMDRGVPFLKPREIEIVSALKAKRMALVAKRREEAAAEPFVKRESRITYMARLETDALKRLTKHFDASAIEIVQAAAASEGRGFRHLVGQTTSAEATRARDVACFRLHRAGYTNAAMAAAFWISESHITISRNRGGRFLGVFPQ